MSPGAPGMTQSLVSALGFTERHGRLLLLDEGRIGRAFLELESDPDHPGARPGEAYEQLLAGLQPGMSVRLLQRFWPDPEPRARFLDQLDRQPKSPPGSLADRLQAGLSEFLRSAPLPFRRRTLLELVIPGPDALEWLDAAEAILSSHGVQVRRLAPEDVQAWAAYIFHPELP